VAAGYKDPGYGLLYRWIIGVMPDRGHRGEGEHDERDVAVPSVPGTGFVVVETQLVFRGFKAVLDGPAAAFDFNQHCNVRSGGTPGGEERQISIGDCAPDQNAPRPKAG